MNVFITIVAIILFGAFFAFFAYEVVQLVRDIKKHIEKKKLAKSKTDKDNQTK